MKKTIHLALAPMLAALSLISPSARAASFDCGKAASLAEKRICADTGLSAQDSAMAEAYSKLQNSLPNPLKDIVRHDQRDWVKMRDAWVADPNRKTDLAGLMRERIAALTPKRTGTLEFLILHEISRPPFLLSAVTGQDMFNHWARKQWNDSVPDEDDETDKPAPGDPDEVRCNDGYTYSINLASPALLSIGRVDTTSCEGAAHPSSQSAQFNWWLERNKVLTERDMFKDKSWRKLVADQGIAQIEDALGPYPQRKALNGVLLDMANWQLTPDSLHIALVEEGLFGHAVAVENVDIPWSQVDTRLTPEFRAALGRAKK